MRASQTRNGVTLRAIAGTYNVILGMDLAHEKLKGCLGFSIKRTDLDPKDGEKMPARFLPNMLKFPTDQGIDPITTKTAPLQKFRWGDYTCEPGKRYRYCAVPRYGKPGALKDFDERNGATVEVTTESTDLTGPTAVFFNRGAAASRAFELKFPNLKTEQDVAANAAAKAWLSRGLKEALLDFLGRAKGPDFALHAAIYEFQQPELLTALQAARTSGSSVSVVYHAREKGPKDTTKSKNRAAIEAAKLDIELVPRTANPQDGIMHNKFVVLLHKGEPVAVWTGSTNWTDGALYGQLNVGHAINDLAIARIYERYHQILKRDLGAEGSKHAVETLTPTSHVLPPARGITPIFSPQSTESMLFLYSNICANARCLLVCAPFALSPRILSGLTANPGARALRFFLLDKEASLGKRQEVTVIENDPANALGIATTLKSPLHDFQGGLLEGKESFRHAGIHIHAKMILADPFGANPILVMGSANFSHNSTQVNDSNSLVFRGDTAVADIYAGEFMRMFEHYHFRASQAAAETHKQGAAAPAQTVLSLAEDDSWAHSYYVAGSHDELDRMTFAGTFH